MTNAEKFEEVFGVRPDVEMMVLDCPTILQSECQYREDVDMVCHCEKWWDEEYKEKPMIEIKPPEENQEQKSKTIMVKTDSHGPILIKNGDIASELHELNKTLKEILRVMKVRKV